MTKIFVNPGHSLDGKPDAGCVYNGIRECDIAAKIAEQLEKALRFNGFQVDLYQQTGEGNNANKQLNKVCQVANASRADLFISIHMNGFTNPDAKGTETWHAQNSSKGKLLAGYVNTELSKPYKSYQFVNRGAKVDQRGLAVLKYTNMPAILTEIGFISNKAEAEFIKTNVSEIAQRLCNAICKYFDKTPKVYQEVISNDKQYPQEIILTHVGKGKYDVNVDLSLKLSNNQLQTCLNWINKTYV